MMKQNADMAKSSLWERRSFLVLGLVIVLSAWSIMGLVMTFSLPTDGWLLQQPDPFDNVNYTYRENLMGAPSGLQPGDQLVAIEGITTRTDLTKLADVWQAGNRVRYTVVRNSAERVDVMVPLVHWQAWPAIKYVIWNTGIGQFVGLMLFAAIALFAFLRRPGDAGARVLFFYATLNLTMSTLVEITNSNPAPNTSEVVGIMSVITILLSYSVLLPPALLHFALVFPRPKPIVQRRRFLIPALYLFGFLLLIAIVTTQIDVLLYAWTITSAIGAILILVHSAFTLRDAISRAQLMWGLYGVIAALLLFLLSFLVTFRVVTGALADVINFVWSLTYAVLGITLGVAVMRYKLFAIDVIIRRTLIYAALTVLLAAAYFGLITVLQQVLAAATGRGDSQLATVASTLAVAGAFLPLRNRVQAFIDRRFYRRKFDAEQAAARFAAEMRDTVTMDDVAAKLFDAVEDTMQPRKIALWVSNESAKT